MIAMERRKFHRHKVNFPITLRFDGRLLEASPVDVSQGGICLQTDYASTSINGSVEVIIDLNEQWKDIGLMGRVVHTETEAGQTIGVQFAKSEKENQKILENYLKRI